MCACILCAHHGEAVDVPLERVKSFQAVLHRQILMIGLLGLSAPVQMTNLTCTVHVFAQKIIQPNIQKLHLKSVYDFPDMRLK